MDHTTTNGPAAELRATLDRLAELQPETKRTPGGVLWVTFGPGDAARIDRGLAALAALEK